MNAVQTVSQQQVKPLDAEAIQAVLLGGDLSKLTPMQKVQYYNKVCETVGLNPLTKPFDYLILNNKQVLYANKGCGEQLRSIHKIGLKVTETKIVNDIYLVITDSIGPDGRTDSATGAVSIAGLKGEQLANAMMKAETKSKRRCTLSHCGLNMHDETEVESIPGAQRVDAPSVGSGRIAPEQPGEDSGMIESTVYTPGFGQWSRYQLHEIAKNNSVETIEKYFGLLESYIATGRFPENHQKFGEFINKMSAYLADQERSLVKGADGLF